MISVYNVETREDLLELRNSSNSEVTWEMLEMESETIFTSDDELRIACWQSLETKKNFREVHESQFCAQGFFPAQFREKKYFPTNSKRRSWN